MTNEGLARRIQQGERDLLLQLWEQVQRYAHDRAYKWFRATNGRGGQTVQDLEQEAFLALLEALEGWDEKAGPFLPWYSLRLKATFTAATAQRTQRDRKDPLQDCLSLDAPLTDREGNPLATPSLWRIPYRTRGRRRTWKLWRSGTFKPVSGAWSTVCQRSSGG